MNSGVCHSIHVSHRMLSLSVTPTLRVTQPLILFRNEVSHTEDRVYRTALGLHLALVLDERGVDGAFLLILGW